jgi:hypothetical protein
LITTRAHHSTFLSPCPSFPGLCPRRSAGGSPTAGGMAGASAAAGGPVRGGDEVPEDGCVPALGYTLNKFMVDNLLANLRVRRQGKGHARGSVCVWGACVWV